MVHRLTRAPFAHIYIPPQEKILFETLHEYSCMLSACMSMVYEEWWWTAILKYYGIYSDTCS